MDAVAGTAYRVTVVAHSAAGSSAAAGPSGEATPTAPVPPSVPPVTDLDLSTTDGPITAAEPGQDVVFTGTGFKPFTTTFITIYSEPIVLGTVVTDANGSFSKSVTIPVGLAAATHTVVAQGIAPDGSVRAMKVDVVVAVGATTPVPAPAMIGSVVRNSDGVLQAFARGGDTSLRTSVQAADGSWGAWVSLGGFIFSEPVAVLNANGRLQVFAIGGDHSLWFRLQNSDGSFAEWRLVGDDRYISTVVVAKNHDGRVQVFGRGKDDNLYYAVQNSTTDPASWTQWTSLGGLILNEPTVVTWGDGRLEVFAMGYDGRTWHRSQSAPGNNSAWSPWALVASSAGDYIAV
jgi:hypothetical protein